MTITLPDRESIGVIHETILLISGGREGVHDEKLILGAIERPVTFVGYTEDFDLNTICALLIDSIARNHGFNDGNKRTALMTAIFTYRVNGVHFKATTSMNEDFDELVIWVVRKKPPIEQISEKLKQLRTIHEGNNEETWAAMIRAFVNAKIGSKH